MNEEFDDFLDTVGDVPVPNRPVLADPSLAASALQKSIRRGAVDDALLAAHTLLQTRPDRFWRRLVVIALEDVGISHPDMLLRVLWLSGRKAFRRDHGGDWPFAAHLVHGLATSPKCRDACDLLVVADWHPYAEQARRELFSASLETLTACVSDSDRYLPERALAAWYLAGTSTYPGVNLPTRKGRYASLADVYERLNVPSEILQVARMGSTRTREAHSVTLPLVFIERSRSTWSKVVQESVEAPVLIGGWPSPTYDMHTRIGRAALNRFAEECQPVRKALLPLVPEPELYELVCSLVFRVEGGLVDRRLSYEGSDELLHTADQAQVCWGSLPLGAVPEALACVRAQLDQLNAIRAESI